MKNLFKYAFALVAGALLLSACTDEYEYTPSDAYQGLYITGEQDTYQFTPADESQSFTVKVVRPQGGAAETYPLTSDNELFTLPESVTFEAGQTEAEITVTCALEAGQEEVLVISLPEGTYDETYFSGNFVISVKCDYVWEDAGVAEYTSPFWEMQKVVSIRHAVGTNMYELVDVFRAGYNLQFTLDDDYNADEIPAVQNCGFTYASYGQVGMEFDPAYGSQFVNEGSSFAFSVFWFVSAGYFNASTGPDFEYFDWVSGYPGEE